MGFRRGSEKAKALGNVPLFSACTRQQLDEIARIADEVEVTAGRVLTVEGRPGREFFVIGRGEAAVEVDGEEVARLGPGKFFGEMSLIDYGPRTATVVAATPMTLYVTDARGFGGLIDAVPSVRRRLMQVVSRRLRESETPARSLVIAG